MRILVVDDSENARDLAEGVLLSAGYTDVLLASSGPEALTILESFRTTNGRVAIDLVFVDIVMPQMDGLEVCARIRKVEGCAHLPIIMLTSLDDTGVLIDALEAGATGYLTKPINGVELVAACAARSSIRQPISDSLQRRLPEQTWTLACLCLIATAALVYIL